jgi:hypothetical protein
MQGAAVLSCLYEVTWVRYPLLSSPLDGMGFVIVAVLSMVIATNLGSVAGAATLVGPEQPREKSSILPCRDVCRWTSHSLGADHPSLPAGFLQQRF